MTASLPTSPATGKLSASVGWYGQIAFVTVDSPLDFFTAQDAQRMLLDLIDHEPSQVLVDVHGAFVDSSGIGVLVRVAQRARQERRQFRVICHQRLAEVLHLHGLDDLLGINTTSAEAFKPRDGSQLLAA